MEEMCVATSNAADARTETTVVICTQLGTETTTTLQAGTEAEIEIWMETETVTGAVIDATALKAGTAETVGTGTTRGTERAGGKQIADNITTTEIETGGTTKAETEKEKENAEKTNLAIKIVALRGVVTDFN